MLDIVLWPFIKTDYSGKHKCKLEVTQWIVFIIKCIISGKIASLSCTTEKLPNISSSDSKVFGSLCLQVVFTLKPNYRFIYYFSFNIDRRFGLCSFLGASGYKIYCKIADFTSFQLGCTVPV